MIFYIFTSVFFFFVKSPNHFKVGIMLCRKDNDKVPGGKFRFFFSNFSKNANGNPENTCTFKSVPLAFIVKISPEIKTFSSWPGSFFFSFELLLGKSF